MHKNNNKLAQYRASSLLRFSISVVTIETIALRNLNSLRTIRGKAKHDDAVQWEPTNAKISKKIITPNKTKIFIFLRC